MQFDYFRLYCQEFDKDKKQATEKVFDLNGALNKIKSINNDKDEDKRDKKIV